MSEVAKQVAILRTLAEQVAQPVVAGRDGRKALKPKQRNQWKQITDRVIVWEKLTAFQGLTQSYTPKVLAEEWQGACKFAGIGVGWFASWVFWNWAFPLLIELAKRWIESQHNSDMQQGLAGER